jgi:hypothetical protein
MVKNNVKVQMNVKVIVLYIMLVKLQENVKKVIVHLAVGQLFKILKNILELSVEIEMILLNHIFK